MIINQKHIFVSILMSMILISQFIPFHAAYADVKGEDTNSFLSDAVTPSLAEADVSRIEAPVAFSESANDSVKQKPSAQIIMRLPLFFLMAIVLVLLYGMARDSRKYPIGRGYEIGELSW